MKAILIWGNQLTLNHNSALQSNPSLPVIMIESLSACRKHKYHKQKLRFVLTAMRDFADELVNSGRTVWYSRLDESEENWFNELKTVCDEQGVDELVAMRQNDRTPQDRLSSWTQEHSIRLTVTPNEMFMTPTSLFNEWAEQQNRLQLEQFYRWQRKRLDILMDGSTPVGGKWNYDAENRKPLPRNVTIPEITFPTPSKHQTVVDELIEIYFSDHPGSLETSWLPTQRQAALNWLGRFLAERFAYFGEYEDAMRNGETFLFHSALSPLLNIGLLHAEEVVAKALECNVPIAAKEGFIRQIIGWREFMFGLYNFRPLDWKQANYLEQHESLLEWWWELSDAPEPPLNDVLQRLEMYGYSHHIERLMVLGNYMLISNYSPQQVYDWFMAMYVDAYEWVMVGNVIGMSQYADGGLDNGGFASKPYISGSNYLQKMGSWWPTVKASKESKWTELYWGFLERHADKLSNNYRLKPLLKRFEKK